MFPLDSVMNTYRYYTDSEGSKIRRIHTEQWYFTI